MTGSPYDALLELAYRERDLVAAGRFDELGPLGFEWEELTAGLPEPTPSERKLLEEIQLTVWTTIAAVRLSLEDTKQLMTLVHRGRRAIDSYAGSGNPSALNAHS